MTRCVVVEALFSGRMMRVVPLLSRHPTPREILSGTKSLVTKPIVAVVMLRRWSDPVLEFDGFASASPRGLLTSSRLRWYSHGPDAECLLPHQHPLRRALTSQPAVEANLRCLHSADLPQSGRFPRKARHRESWRQVSKAKSMFVT